MQQRPLIGTLVLALAAMGIALAGCGSRSEGPAAAPAPGPQRQGGSQGPADQTPAVEEPIPQIKLTLSCPEQVDVGKEFTAEIVVENSGRAAAADLVLSARFDSGLEQVESAAPVRREVGSLGPGASHRVAIRLRATRPGTFSHTAEVTQGDKVLASRWTTVTVTGPAEEAAAGEPAAGPPEAEEPPPGPDLGPPLVENADALQPLDPSHPVWFDKAGRSVVMVGEVCQREAPLELFACLRGSKEYESVVAVATKAYVVHAGLLAAGAEPGGPVRFDPEYTPPRGPVVEVQVIWKDPQGKKQTARAQQWVRNVQTGKAMSAPWVFAGSRFVHDQTTGKPFYLADVDGDLICVANFPSAVLDVPVKSTDSDAALMFDAFTERIPPRGTPVTLVLTPKP